mgnify:CR=1 FL=1
MDGEAALVTELPESAMLFAHALGPAELLAYGRKLRGIVLDNGPVGPPAAFIARGLAVPLVVRAGRVTEDALTGDHIMVDGEQGIAHLRPDESVVTAFRDKIAMLAAAQERYTSIRDKPAQTRCGEFPRRSPAAVRRPERPCLGLDGR